MASGNNIKFDQHFFTDSSLLQKMVRAAGLQKEDIVLEIGPGKGILTRELAKKVKKVVAVEIDLNLKIFLGNLPHNVEVVFMNIIDFLPLRKWFNKIVANIPYQVCEPLLQYLCTAEQVELAVLTVPKHFVKVAQEHPVLSAWLEVKLLGEVPPESFDPKPKVQSALIKITRNQEENDSLFLVRHLSGQRDKKVKNGLRESIMTLSKKHQKAGTKKQAEKILQQLHLPEKIKEGRISRLPLRFYSEIAEAIKKIEF